MNAPSPFLLSDGPALRQQALSAYADGNPVVARDLLIRAVAADPLDADAQADLAGIELEGGHLESAIRHARRALVLTPKHDTGRYVLACASHQKGDARTAIEIMADMAEDADLRQRNPELSLAASEMLTRWAGQSGSASGLEIVSPAALCLSSRFDILVKYLYAMARLQLLPLWANVDPVALYRRHIHLRTGGIEPGREQCKSSVDDYVRQFDALIDAMARDGFNPAFPVPLSQANDLPRGGAHRLAAALAVSCDVVINHQAEPGWSWDEPWFRAHGFSIEERNVLLRTWANLKRESAAITVLWSPVEAVWEEMEAVINKELPIVSRRTVELPRAGFDELVRDMYALATGPRHCEQIERKIALLESHVPRVRVLFLERPDGLADEAVKDLKTHLRERYAHISPVNHFTTLHMSDCAAETGHLLDILASANNLQWLAQRRAAQPQLLEHIAELQAQTEQRQIPRDAYCVVGGSVLDALGLRNADDLDFTLRSAERSAHFDDGVSVISPALDIVTRGYARSPDGTPTVDDDQLIGNPDCHFMVRGVRFADPRIVLARKQQQRREKDVRDVALLADWFERIGLASTTPPG